jgi:hypothetical protein
MRGSNLQVKKVIKDRIPSISESSLQLNREGVTSKIPRSSMRLIKTKLILYS